MLDFSSFNANQLRAVNWGAGPVMVLAGPGSGKTRVLTHRIARIMEESAGESFRILGLTFTERAAREMQRRVNDLIPNADGRVSLTTFHGFSADILRQHGHHLGIRPDFKILSQDAERLDLLDDAISRAGMARSEDYTGRHLLSLVTKMTDQNIAVETAAESLQAGHYNDAQQIGDVYSSYRQLMIENNELDFGALVAEALRLLSKPAGAQLIRRIYPYICVDEFQDTNLAQYQILCSIVDPFTKNLFAVADDDQTIYEWNGAAIKRIKSLQEQFGATVLELPENYRCPSGVVRIANRLITDNSSHHKTESIANKQDGSNHLVRVKKFDTVEEEADWVARDIAKRPASSRSNCAVLARTRIALERVVDALNEHDLHGHVHASKKEFANDRMVWLHSVLRLANSRQDDLHLRRVCKSFYVLEGVNLMVDGIVSEAKMMGGDYLRAWTRAALREKLDRATGAFLAASMPKLADNFDVRGFVQDCFEWLEIKQKNDPAPDYETHYKEEKDVWNEMAANAADAIGHGQVTLNRLLQYIDLQSKEPPVPEGAIPCYTIYASKGMEFDHVYLIRLAEDELPHWRAVKKGNTSNQMQEERRVCFVAITRTQKSLTLTYPLSISGHAKKPSRFLTEMGIMQD